MNKQRKTSHILNVFQYDADGHVVLPASLTLGIVPGAEDNSGKVPSTAWVRGLVSTTSSSLVPISRSITINGTSYDLSSNRSWSIDTGVLTASAGSGISVSVVNQNLNIVNTGLLTGTAGAGISVSTVNQNLNIVNTGLLTGTAGAGISVSTVNQNLNIVNTGLLTASSGLGISVSTVGQNLNIVNTGILTASAGSGISVSVVGQNLNIVNSGILTATAGAGISLSVVDGNLNIVNTITNNNQLTNGAGYATTSYVTTQINNLVAGAPGLLDTLDELAAALGDDANFATTTATSLGNRLRIDIGTQGLTSTQQGYGRTNLGLGTAALSATGDFATAAQGTKADTAFGWGNHASAGYLTTSSAASTYVSLTGSYANPSWITSLAYSKITGVPAFLTSYTETDTLATVTSRGNTTSNSVRFGSHVDLSPTGSAFRFYDGTTFRGGFGLDSWGHGGSDANLVLYVNGDNTLFFSTNGTKRANLSSSAFNSLVALQQNGNQVLHAGNYSSYAFPASGGTLNGYLTVSANWATSPYTSALTIIGTYPSITFRGSNSDWEWLQHVDSSGNFHFYGGAGYTANNWSNRATFKTSGQLILKNHSTADSGYDNPLWIWATADSDAIVIQNTTSGGTPPKIYFRDTNGIIQTGNSEIRLRTSNSNSYSAYLNGGDWYATGSMRAPIFYDSNNTSYYVDPDSTSNVNAITMAGTLAMYGGAYYGTITFGTSSYWRAGISQRDAGNAELRIWAKGGGAGSIYFATGYDGESSSVTLPSDGMALKNNNLGLGSWGVSEFPSYKLHVKGTAYATSDMRAPIFYDSDDTSYYLNPHSTSELRNLYLGAHDSGASEFLFGENSSGWYGMRWYWDSGVNFYWYGRNAGTDTLIMNYTTNDNTYAKWHRHFHMNSYNIDYVGTMYMNGGVYISTNNNRNLQIQSSGSSDNGIYGRGSGGQFAYQLYGDGGGSYGFLNGVWASWDLRKATNGRLYMNDNNGYYLQTNSDSYVYRLESATDLRAPIFYDSNNTGYYLDPDNTSRLYASRYDYIGVGQSINTSYRIIVSGDYYANAAGNFWAEGRFKQYRGSGTWHDVIDSGNIGSQSVSSASMLPTLYAGGVQSNPQTYFGQSVGLRVAMTGHWSVWSDTLWINGYAGGDVLQMCALHTLRNGQPRIAISAQASNSSSYGGVYELWSSYNMDAPNKSGTSYYQVNTWLQMNGTHGIYWPSYYGSHIYVNTTTTYTNFRWDGQKNGYDGVWLSYSSVNGMMYDSGGNGGVYREANGRWYWYHHVGNNCTGISTSTTSSSYRAYIGGALYAEGDIVAYSDVRKKTDIVTIDNALEKVINLRGVYYTRIDDVARGRQTGVIAQEINQVLPEVVTYASDVDEYGVSYGNIVGVLIEAIKEQQNQIEELQNKLDNVLSSR